MFIESVLASPSTSFRVLPWHFLAMATPLVISLACLMFAANDAVVSASKVVFRVSAAVGLLYGLKLFYHVSLGQTPW